MTRAVLGLAVGLLLLAASAAHAGTVTYTPAHTLPPENCGGKCPSAEPLRVPESLVYTAAPGETNDVTIAETTIRDAAGITIATGSQSACSQVDATTVSCRATTALPEIRLGDGNDRASDTGRRTRLSGGDGDDVLTGGKLTSGDAGADHLTGTAESDDLGGGTGPDRVEAGAGDDVIRSQGDPGAPDQLDGGAGDDTLSYALTRTGVTVDLANPAASEDAFTGIERLVGSSAADVLSGTEGPDRIDGGRGNDRVDGRGGDDALTVAGLGIVRGGGGNDTLTLASNSGLPSGAFADGGPGDDTILNGRPEDLIVCGAGRDTLRDAQMNRPYRADDCELGGGFYDAPSIDRGAIRLSGAYCPRREIGAIECRLTLKLTVGTRRLAFATRKVTLSRTQFPATADLVARLYPSIKRRLRRGRRYRAIGELRREVLLADGTRIITRGRARYTITRTALR
jgi:hypothetical protein